jgi:hypothetical protein
MLLQRLGRIKENVEEFAEFMFRPEPRPLPSLVELVDRLLRPEREHTVEESDTEENFEELQADAPFLSQEEHDEAGEIIASIANRCALRDLLEEMAAEGRSRKIQDFVVTTLLKSVGDAGSSIHVRANGSQLRSCAYAGDDLLIEPSTLARDTNQKGRAAVI